MTIDFQKVADAIEKSTPEIKDLMFSAELGDTLFKIAEKNNLDEDKYLQMVDEVGYVILELKESAVFENNLIQIGVDKNISQTIGKEIKDSIFSKIGGVKNTSKPAESSPKKSSTVFSTFAKQTTSAITKKQAIIRWSERFFSDKSVANRTEEVKKIKIAIKEKASNNSLSSTQNLPQFVQDLVFAGAWEERTREVAKKYSLNATQLETLVDNVLFVLLGLESGENFINLISSELGISKLLSEQIIDELDIRVFEYSIKSVENKENKENIVVEPVVNKAPLSEKIPLKENKTSNNTPIVQASKIPEIRPNIVPMVEKDEPVKIVQKETPVIVPPPTKPHFVRPEPPVFIPKKPEIKTEAQKPETPVAPEKKFTIHSTFNSNAPTDPKLGTEARTTPAPVGNHITYKPKDVVAEVVQQPIAVPRFNASAPEPETIEPTKEIPKVQNNTNPTPFNTLKEKVPIPATEKLEEKPTPKYTVDPYREPIN